MSDFARNSYDVASLGAFFSPYNGMPFVKQLQTDIGLKAKCHHCMVTLAHRCKLASFKCPLLGSSH